MKALHFAVIFLSLVIVSTGVSSAFAQNLQCGRDQVIRAGECVDAFDDDEMPESPIIASTDRTSYSSGNTIVISGSVADVDPELKGDITLIVISPIDNTVVSVAQVSPDSNGGFSKSFLASPPKWANSGKYTITVTYGTDTRDVTFHFEKAAAPVTPTCEAGTSLVNGVCVEDGPEPPVDVPPPPPEPPVVTPDPVSDPEPVVPDPVVCGEGTELDENGICQVIQAEPEPTPEPADPQPGNQDNGCLIATAAYGTELAPQVQMLREIRDHTLYSTASGTSFMAGFNQVYYLFSPTIADWERQSPVFRDMVRTAITPMMASLGIMTLADSSESQVLGYGLSVIALNLGMYVAAPAGAVIGIRRYVKTRIQTR